MVWDGQNRRQMAKNGNTLNETRPYRLRLKQDFQNCLQNFPSFNIKKVTYLASLTVWNRRKRRATAKKRQKPSMKRGQIAYV